MCPATKLGTVVTFHERLPPTKSHDPLITWSCEITGRTKIIVTAANRVAMATKLGRIVTYLTGYYQ